MSDFFTNLHFLRPQWLWLLLFLPLLAWWWHRRAQRAEVWRNAVDAHLLAHLLETDRGARGYAMPVLGLTCFVLAVLALSGPGWHQVEQPLWQTRAPLVIALDLSSATTATDLPPSRLLQARAKIDALLRQREGGQVGLVAYAGAAFTVAPLTDDGGNVAVFLDALEPSIMPIDGQRTDLAIQWSAKLLRQAGFDHGQILILSDHADAAARAAAAMVASNGYRVSALGLGTAAGAAYRRRSGEIAHAQLDMASLRALANAGGGKAALLTADSSDLDALGVLDPQGVAETAAQDGRSRIWQDQGYWLLLPLLLLGLFAFRRGGAVAALLLCLYLPMQPALAAQSIQNQDLWQRQDQQRYQQMQRGRQAYRAGKFDAAAQAWNGLELADASYNLGNALAKAGKYQEAIAAYEAALQAQPGMPDALANKAAVEALLKQKKSNKEQGQKKQKDGQKGDQDSQGSDSKQSPGNGQKSDDSKSNDQAAQEKSQTQQGDDGKSLQPTDAGDGKPKAPDADAQQAADAAQRERMQRALRQAQQAQGKDNKDKAEPASEMQADPNETLQQRERRLANQAWLNRVPDDPGGLLRRKFALEYQRRQQQGEP